MVNFKRNTAEHADNNPIDWFSANPLNLTALQLHEKLISNGKASYQSTDNAFEQGFLAHCRGNLVTDVHDFFLSGTKHAGYWIEGYKVAENFYSQNSTI